MLSQTPRELEGVILPPPAHSPSRPFSQSPPCGSCLLHQNQHLSARSPFKDNQFLMSKQPKGLSQKTAEKFCETLRGSSVESFKQMMKALQIRERNSNNQECLAKLQGLLTLHPALTRQINDYLEDTVRLQVQNDFVNKIEELFAYVKSKNYEHINVIIEALKKFGKEMSSGDGTQTKQSEDKLKKKFLELFKDDEDTYNKAKEILYQNQFKDKPAPEPPKSRRGDGDYLQDHKYRNIRREPRGAVKELKELPLRSQEARTTPDDMQFILKLQKSWSQKKYASAAKVIFLFQHCIIGMNEAFDILSEETFDSPTDFESFKDLVETREGSRRSISNPFKPLNDTDFSNSIRATFSYVQMPWCYPILCKGKTKQLRSILNDKWVSVPHGSQHSNFYIRAKNQFQDLLLKSEDERYQFDIYSYRLKVCEKLLDKIIAKPEMAEEEVNRNLHHVIGMNIIQTIYKNTTKEQKEDLEKQLKHNLLNTCLALKQRVEHQRTALENIRNIHGIKAWMDVADKNFVKSLDRKSSEFKRNEKENTKLQFFETEAEEKLKCLRRKEKPNIFQERTTVFAVLNSFESYSKIERCLSHQISQEEIPTYPLQSCAYPNLLPILMMLFDNREVSSLTYSLFVYYLNNYLTNETERSRVKKVASKFFEKILNFDHVAMSLPEGFKEDEFYDFIAKYRTLSDPASIPPLVIPEVAGIPLYDEPKNPEMGSDEKMKLKIKNQLEREFAFNPPKNEHSDVWFFSFNMYVVLRMIYTLYERLLKAVEILHDYKNTKTLSGPVGGMKLALFKVLFMLCVKSKENSKFEDNLGELFGEEAYLFSTIYKLLESLSKVLQTTAGDFFSTRLLDIVTSDPQVSSNQTLYFLQVNRLTISHNNSDNIFRVHHDHRNNLFCVNYFKSTYKSWDDGNDKKLEEKLEDIQRNVEFYVTQPTLDSDSKNKAKKKEKKPTTVEGSNNRMEYYCSASSLKLYSRVEYEDFFSQNSRRIPNATKYLKKEVKRALRSQELLHNFSLQTIAEE